MTLCDRAPFGRRLAALFLDLLIFVPFALLLARPIQDIENALGLVRFASIDTNAEAWMVIILALWGNAWVYLFIEAVFAGTPGKLIFGLRVRAINGGPAGIGRRLGRYLLKCGILLIVMPFGMVEGNVSTILLLAVGLVSILGLFLVLGPRRQTLYDRISGTAVGRAPRP